MFLAGFPIFNFFCRKDSILFRRQTKTDDASQQNEEQPSRIKEFISSNVKPSRLLEEVLDDPRKSNRSREVRRIDQPIEDARQRDKSREDARRRDRPREIRRRDKSVEGGRRDGSREDRREGSREDVRRDSPKMVVRRDVSREKSYREMPREDSRRDRPREEIRRDNPKEAVRRDMPREDKREGSREVVRRDRPSRSSRTERQRESNNDGIRKPSGQSPVRGNDPKNNRDKSKTRPAKTSAETAKPIGDVNFVSAAVNVEYVPVNKESAANLKEVTQPEITEPLIPAVVPNHEDDNQDTSTESNSSSTKENSQESKLVRAERLHQKKISKKIVTPEMSLKKEIKKISPLRKAKSPQNLNQCSSTVDEEDGQYNDLLSSLLASEKDRINKSVKKKKLKKSVSLKASPKNSPDTPGKFLIEGNALPPALTPVLPMVNGASDEHPTSSPEFLGVPETPGKSLLAILSADLESSPSKVIAEQHRKELESAVYSILPTPMKLLTQCPLLSPLHNTPIITDMPRHLISNKTPEVETTSPEKSPAPPPALVEIVPTPQQSSIIDSSVGDETPTTSSAQQTPSSSKPSFPFRRKRVLKIKCTTSNNSSLGENSSMEEPPVKKACTPTVQLPMPSLFSPPKQPEPRLQKVPNPSVVETAASKKVKSPSKKIDAQKAAGTKSVTITEPSPSRKIVTPNKKIELTTPASISSTGRKSNDSGASQDFRLHYTSDSEVSRSPSPYLPQHPATVMTTSTPHPDKKRLKIVNDAQLVGLTPNSKKKQKRKTIMSEMFGASPASEREYLLDLDVTEEMRKDLQASLPKSKAPAKKSYPAEDNPRIQRSKIEYEEKSRPTADRIKYKPVSRSPDYYRKRSPGDRRRSPLEERRKSPDERERRRSPPERRRSPDERRRSPDERYRRRSPEERERRRSPDDRDRRRYLDERSRRKSPVDRDRRISPDDRERRRYLDERRRSPDHRDKRRVSDERDRKYR